MRPYTRTGDDGTTGRLHGGRVSKASLQVQAQGDIDEAQAAIGLSRAHVPRGGEVDSILVGLCHDLYVVGAQLATAPENRAKLEGGVSLVTEEMVAHLESLTDMMQERFEPLREFVIPGQTPQAASLDMARAVTRRAERSVIALTEADPGIRETQVIPFLNRLSDLLWTAARALEDRPLPAKQTSSDMLTDQADTSRS